MAVLARVRLVKRAILAIGLASAAVIYLVNALWPAEAGAEGTARNAAHDG